MNREEFFELLPLDRYHAQDLLKIQSAYWAAKEGHKGAFRDNKVRVFEHPRGVAVLLIEFGFTDPDSICVALLHDAVEDTVIPTYVYLALFGPKVWKWVETLSKKVPHFDPITGKVTGYLTKDPNTYYQGILRLPREGRVIKLCDRLFNLRDCGVWDNARKHRYLFETESKILPIADATDPVIAQLIRDEVEKIRKNLV